MIEPVRDPDAELVSATEKDEAAMEEEGNLSPNIDQLAICIHALAGYSTPQAMRVRGFIKGHPVVNL